MIQDIYNQNINTLDLREALISDRKDEIAVQDNKEIPKELESISFSTASELLSQIDNLGNALNDIFTTPLDFNQEEK